MGDIKTQASVADELRQAAEKLRANPERPVDEPLAAWLESWDGVELDERGPLPEDFEHALAVARVLNGAGS